MTVKHDLNLTFNPENIQGRYMRRPKLLSNICRGLSNPRDFYTILAVIGSSIFLFKSVGAQENNFDYNALMQLEINKNN